MEDTSLKRDCVMYTFQSKENINPSLIYSHPYSISLNHNGIAFVFDNGYAILAQLHIDEDGIINVYTISSTWEKYKSSSQYVIGSKVSIDDLQNIYDNHPLKNKKWGDALAHECKQTLLSEANPRQQKEIEQLPLYSNIWGFFIGTITMRIAML